MAADMFIKIDDIKGEAVDPTHGDEIKVLSWSWGMSQSGTTHDSAGGGAGKVNVQDLSVTKFVDLSSPNLIKMCCSGKHFSNALRTVRKAGDKPVEYLKIKMMDLLISNVSTGGSGGEDRVTENITLNFAKVQIDYTSQKKDGTPDKTVTTAWNIQSNTDKC
jgi:type VI secretion system secreted protein Hcp